MTLIRLTRQTTDLTITVTIPEERQVGEEGSLVVEGKEIAEVVVGSLRVREWGLFGGG